MSEQDVNKISSAIIKAISSQEEASKGERWFTQGIMICMLGVVTFIGYTVIENSSAIAIISEKVHTLHASMLDRYTGQQGKDLERRVGEMEKEHAALMNAYNQLTGIVNLHIAKDAAQFESFKDTHRVEHGHLRRNIDKHIDAYPVHKSTP